MRRGDRDHRDANDERLTKYFQAKGASVRHLPIGGGAPDKLIGYRGVTALAEFKPPAGPKGGTSMRNLTKKQKNWIEEWNGSVPWLIRTPEHADIMLTFMAVTAQILNA